MASHKQTVRVNMGTIELVVSSDPESAERMLDGLDKAFDPIRLAYNLLGDNVLEHLRERAEKRFESEGDELTGPWAELSPYTQEMREAGGFGPAHPINVRTGAMKRHILRDTTDAYPHSMGATLYFPARGGSPESISKVETAQMGDERTVARPVLGVGIKDMELILLAIGVHIAEFQPGGGQGMFG